MIKNDNNFRCGFLWADLEMTGLSVERDLILEISLVGTDTRLERLVEGPSLVISQPLSALEAMDDWCREHHKKSGLWDAVLASKISLEAAEAAAVDFVKANCTPDRLILAGNTVYQDRIFLRRYMPELEALLHYRLIDVSSIKELVKAWYPKDPASDFVKKKSHRAHDDVIESIEELRHYRAHFWKSAE